MAAGSSADHSLCSHGVSATTGCADRPESEFDSSFCIDLVVKIYEGSTLILLFFYSITCSSLSVSLLQAHSPAGGDVGEGEEEKEEDHLLKAFEEIQYLIEDLDNANSRTPVRTLDITFRTT